ncbi:hypothetical protein LNJ08_06040 [Tenacibaculum finnmarkense genomovar ulcerans]|uniref:hypothetical protein n=1 Tax=Tenacibaculum finnmarkense TaxID=2781243 RepID=UPI001E30EEAC|nr:hypothetical protein [Tenacibaculum finnmarkense]MCD8453949.1 hypothetical protein [Tenacibaculum finnmarkense genomovar ulcerans]
MTQYNTYLSVLFFCFLFISFKTNAQEIKLVDNKGTIKTVNNNTVTTGTAPTNPLEGDVWFDTANNEIKIYDADEPIVANRWKKLSDTTTQNIYTTNGTLNSDRILYGDTKNLQLTGIKDLSFSATNMYASANYIQYNSSGFFDIYAVNVNFYGDTRITENLYVEGGYRDSGGSYGSTGQILSSTTVGALEATHWVDSSTITHTGTTGSIFFAGSDGKPTENNTQLTWDNTAFKLYVGTPFNIADANKLTVNGTARATRFRSSNGTVGDPAFKFSDDNNTGIYRIAADQLGFTTNGVNALSIDATQNISIPKNLSVTGTFADTTGDVGTAGQVLSSTTTGTNWVDAAPTKAARIFYPPSIAIDASSTGTSFTNDLYQEYSNQFTLADNTTSTASAGAPAAIPTYLKTELYYYVTYYDKTIFSNVSIDANGVMTYDVIAVPTDDNTLINVVFVVK